MVFTLHRYIFRDLLKTFVLATTVLSLVLGLGVMLRPLRDFSVDPVNVPKLLAYTLPITLTMVIPISALLAATVNYGRLAVDNEITACRSSGISLTTLVYPALTLALLVGMATLALGFHVVPSFTKKFEQLFKTDAQGIIFRNIEKRGDLGSMFKNIRIYADHALPAENRLSGVAVLKLARGRDIEWALTAEHVQVEFVTEGPEKQIRLHLYHAVAMLPDGTFSSDIGPETIMTVPLPNLWEDHIKFKNLRDLKIIRQDMTEFGPIRELLGDIREQVLAEQFFEWCDGQLQGPNGYVELSKGADRVRIFAGGCKREADWEALGGGGEASGGVKKRKRSAQEHKERSRSATLRGPVDEPIRIVYTYGEQEPVVTRVYEASKASLKVTTYAQQLQAVVAMEEVAWRYGSEGDERGVGESGEEAVARLAVDTVTGIELGGALRAQAARVSLTEDVLAERVPLTSHEPSAYLKQLYRRAQKEARELATEIQVELHCRLAFGVSCVVLVLLGAALGILFRSGHLLTAFGVSFVPAALCLITIFTGQHIAEQGTGGGAGLAFLWSGIAAVGVADFFIFKALLKR